MFTSKAAGSEVTAAPHHTKRRQLGRGSGEGRGLLCAACGGQLWQPHGAAVSAAEPAYHWVRHLLQNKKFVIENLVRWNNLSNLEIEIMATIVSE